MQLKVSAVKLFRYPCPAWNWQHLFTLFWKHDTGISLPCQGHHERIEFPGLTFWGPEARFFYPPSQNALSGRTEMNAKRVPFEAPKERSRVCFGRFRRSSEGAPCGSTGSFTLRKSRGFLRNFLVWWILCHPRSKTAIFGTFQLFEDIGKSLIFFLT